MSSAASEQARQSGFKHLIKEMHKLEVGKIEKNKPAESTTPKLVKPTKTGKKTPVVNNEIRDMVKGFFQKKEDQQSEKAGGLFVGKIKKSNGPDRPLESKPRKRRKKV